MLTRKKVPVYFAKQSLLPAGFKYPSSYVNYIASNPPNIIGPINEDWCFFDVTEIDDYFRDVRRVSPKSELVPFMRRNGDDGVVCFDCSTAVDEPAIFYCNVFQNKGCWPEESSFAEWLAKVPPNDMDDMCDV